MRHIDHANPGLGAALADDFPYPVGDVDKLDARVSRNRETLNQRVMVAAETPVVKTLAS